jgi:hypothetical protein
MFGRLGFGGSPAPEQPQQQQQAQQQQNAGGQAPAGQTNQGQTGDNLAAQISQGQQPAQQQQATNLPAIDTSSPFNLLQAMTGRTASVAAAPTQDDLAGQFISAMLGQQTAQPTAGESMRIDTAALAQAYGSMDLTSGIDFGAILTQMQSGDANAAQTSMKALMQQSSLNTITALAPLLQQAMTAAVQSAKSEALSEGSNNMRSQALITAFGNKFAYGSNPIVQGFLQKLAPLIAKSAPAGSSTEAMVDMLNDMFKNMSSSMVGNNQGQQQAPGVITDFASVFK